MFRYLVALSFLLLCIPAPLFAQEQFELTDGKYQVVITQNPDVIESGSVGTFSLQLQNLQGNLIVQTQAWVEVSHEGKKIFSSPDFRSVDGSVDFSQLFDHSGDYLFTVRMINSKNLDEANVNFTTSIIPSKNDSTSTFNQQNRKFAIISIIIGILAGASITKALTRKK